MQSIYTSVTRTVSPIYIATVFPDESLAVGLGTLANPRLRLKIIPINDNNRATKNELHVKLLQKTVIKSNDQIPGSITVEFLALMINEPSRNSIPVANQQNKKQPVNDSQNLTKKRKHTLNFLKTKQTKKTKKNYSVAENAQLFWMIN